jgi:Ni/Fe-hydrogenase subunit HybB-like protein
MMNRLNALVDLAALKTVPSLLAIERNEAPLQARGKRLLRGVLALALLGSLAILTALVQGHHAMGTTSEMPWGVLIASYIFFVATTSGLCLVGSLGHVFGFERFEPIAKKATFLSLVLLLIGYSILLSELERPLRLVWTMLSPNPRSPIWWMGTLYGLYTVVLLVELYFQLAGDHRRGRIAGIVGIVAAIAAQSNLGAVLGLARARPAWYGPFLPVYFIALALMCGAALLILAVWLEDFFTNDGHLRSRHRPLMDSLRGLLALFVGVVGFFTFWRVLAGASGGHAHQHAVAMVSLSGPMFVSFWLGEVFLGLVVPLVLLLGVARHKTKALALAAGFSIFGLFIMRYNLIVSGQMLSLKSPAGREGELNWYAPAFKGTAAGLLSYTPSIVEIGVVLGALAMGVLAYVVGSRVLRLNQELKP